jgi:hypothetical protein
VLPKKFPKSKTIALKIAQIPNKGICAIYFHGGGNSAKSEHVYFIGGMLVLLLDLAKKD